MLKIRILGMAILLAVVTAAQQREMWHHATSSYRAVYDITSRPSHAKGGLLLNVPVCGIGMAEGEDVYCFDERGRQLSRMPLGASAENCALVLTQAPDDAKRIYAYFGSKIPAPVKEGLVAPLICEVRTLPDGPMKSWPQVEALLKKSKVIGRVAVDAVKQAFNPIDSRTRCIMVFTGMYDARKAKRFFPYITVNGAGYLFLDGKLVHDLSGSHHHGETSSGQQRKDTDFTAGLHDVKIVGLRLDERGFIGLGEAHVQNGKVMANSYISGADFVTALGHTQSLHTNALDEAIALPTDFSARIARNTQLYIQEETNVCRVVDPWAGSYYVETLTHELAHRAWSHIQEVEKLGGMAKAIESGIPKMRIEEASARKQSRIDSHVDTIVGINKYRLDHEDPIDTLEVDNTAVRKAQIERLAKLRAERNNDDVQAALNALTECASSGNGNLLELSIDAARKRASLGEISYALEKVYGRYKAKINLISNVYSTETKNSESFQKAQQLTDEFAKLEGRRPRIMIAKMGQDGHDRGAKVVATGYADLGFDVDMGPLFQTPEEAAKQAVENDVHVVGVSSLAAGHKTLVPQIIAELKRLGREDIMVVVGGVIPPQDYDFLFKAGAACIFGPGTVISESAIKMLELLLATRQ